MSSLIHLKPKKKLVQQDIAPNDYAEQPRRRIRVNLSDKELKPFEGLPNWEEDLMAQTLQTLDPVSQKPTHDELKIKQILNDFTQREIQSPQVEVQNSIEAKNELDKHDLVFGRKNV